MAACADDGTDDLVDEDDVQYQLRNEGTHDRGREGGLPRRWGRMCHK